MKVTHDFLEAYFLSSGPRQSNGCDIASLIYYMLVFYYYYYYYYYYFKLEIQLEICREREESTAQWNVCII